MKIAVTGASGRVGRHVVAAAEGRGHSVVAIDRAGLDDAVQVDMADYEAVVRAIDGCDALVHLAGIPGLGVLPDHIVHDNNVVGSYHAMRAAAEVGIRNVVQASSVNAIGGRFSASPRYDYFPLDEAHPGYAEDAYSLSKWVCEQQADALARAHPGMTIVSLRLHWVVESRAEAADGASAPQDGSIRHLWGYTTFEATSRAFMQAVEADIGSHEVFYIVAPETMAAIPSSELARTYYPDVELRRPLEGMEGFFDCSKAQEVLGWQHDTTG